MRRLAIASLTGRQWETTVTKLAGDTVAEDIDTSAAQKGIEQVQYAYAVGEVIADGKDNTRN